MDFLCLLGNRLAWQQPLLPLDFNLTLNVLCLDKLKRCLYAFMLATFAQSRGLYHLPPQNSKLLEAIASSKSLYSVQALDQQHSLDRRRVRAISNFR